MYTFHVKLKFIETNHLEYLIKLCRVDSVTDLVL